MMTRYAKYLIHKKYYPRQAPVVSARVSNSNKAVYNMLADAGTRSRKK